MKIKRFVGGMLLLAAAVCFVSCGKEKAETETASRETVPTGFVNLAGESAEEEGAAQGSSDSSQPERTENAIFDSVMWDGAVYYSTPTEIVRLKDGQSESFSPETAALLCANENGLYGFADGVYTEYNGDGAVSRSYETEVNADSMCVTERYAVFAEPVGSGHRLVRLERETGTVEEIPQTMFSYGDSFVVKSLSAAEEDRFLVLRWSDENQARALYGSMVARMDAESGKAEPVAALYNGLPSAIAYDKSSGKVYGVSASLTPIEGKNYCQVYDYSEDPPMVVTSIPAAGAALLTGSGETVEIPMGFDKLQADGGNLFFWSSQAEAVYTDSVFADTLTLLLPNALAVGQDIKNLMIVLQSEYGVQLRVSALDDETYGDKLRTKLLAADRDFDFFLIPSGGPLLGAVLANHAYESLSSCETLVARFNGMFSCVKGLCEKDGDLFAMPFGFTSGECVIAVSPEAEERLPTDQMDQWTIETFLSVAEDYAARRKEGEPFLCETGLLTTLIQSVTQAYADGAIDKEKLTEYETALYHLARTGAVLDSNHLPKMDYTLLLTPWELIPPVGFERETDGWRRTAFPTVAGTSCFTGGGWIFLNRASANKENALSLLETLTQPELMRNSSLACLSYVYPDFTAYANDETRYELSEAVLENFDLHDVLLASAQPYTVDADAILTLLHAGGLWTECRGGLSAEAFCDKLWNEVQKQLYE